jgi:hypothetical protein
MSPLEFDDDAVQKLRDQPAASHRPAVSRAEFVASLIAAPRTQRELTDPLDIATLDEWGHAG